MKNKIILGSANFDQIYGVKKNFIKKSEVKRLFQIAAKNRIKTIDTSPLYKNSEKLIGLLNKKRFKIVSKIPKKPKNIKKQNIKKWVKKNVMISLKNLKIKKFECLLLHDANSLLGFYGDEIYESIKNMKINGFTNKIGISIYDFSTLEKIIQKFKFDIIQAPINILDRRLIEKGWLKKLKKKKIEVHARSIFLQGMLLLKRNQLPHEVKKFNKDWIKWEKWLEKNELNPLDACLSYILNQKKLDGIVIGTNSKQQLKEILKIKKIKKNISTIGLTVSNKNIKDPRKWTN